MRLIIFTLLLISSEHPFINDTKMTPLINAMNSLEKNSPPLVDLSPIIVLVVQGFLLPNIINFVHNLMRLGLVLIILLLTLLIFQSFTNGMLHLEFHRPSDPRFFT